MTMRRIHFLLLALPLTSGCVDALGIGSSCSSEMREVTSARGAPNESEHDEDRGDFTEVWYYYGDGGAGARYVFRWGVSYQECEVQMQSGNFTISPTSKN
jgi:hypothetical protein